MYDYEDVESLEKALKDFGFDENPNSKQPENMSIDHLLNSINFTVSHSNMPSLRKRHIYLCTQQIRQRLKYKEEEI